jgi:hypothetical protein
MMKAAKISVGLGVVIGFAGLAFAGMSELEALASADPKPFVIVEAQGTGVLNRAQGVVISEKGYVLSAAHVSWIGANNAYSDDFRISFRGTGAKLPDGCVHKHKTRFSDKENAEFFEHYYKAELLRQGGSRFLGDNSDVALFRLQKTGGLFPALAFYSKRKPKVRIGEIFYLCHYSFPHKPAEPTLLLNPVEIVGVAQTSSGLQYLAKGYYRVGSSGGALLKDGGLIGIQSAGYTINSKEAGEIPLGLLSFQLVWEEMLGDALERE